MSSFFPAGWFTPVAMFAVLSTNPDLLGAQDPDFRRVLASEPFVPKLKVPASIDAQREAQLRAAAMAFDQNRFGIQQLPVRLRVSRDVANQIRIRAVFGISYSPESTMSECREVYAAYARKLSTELRPICELSAVQERKLNLAAEADAQRIMRMIALWQAEFPDAVHPREVAKVGNAMQEIQTACNAQDGTVERVFAGMLSHEQKLLLIEAHLKWCPWVDPFGEAERQRLKELMAESTTPILDHTEFYRSFLSRISDEELAKIVDAKHVQFYQMAAQFRKLDKRRNE
ncbi:MAG: hypothetical protein R3C53_10900 [Pirellulaceae bacterium]